MCCRRCHLAAVLCERTHSHRHNRSSGSSQHEILPIHQFKSNAPSFSGFLIILLSYPAGHWMARILPTRQFQLWNGRYTFTLNPGPFNAKEHLLITVLAGSGSGAAYGADIITIQDLYYHQDIGHVGGVLLVLSTQMLGFGLSGLVYNLLVRPSKMVWPSTLVPISLFNTLHGQESTITWQRLRFFRLAFLAIFAWQFMPSGQCA